MAQVGKITLGGHDVFNKEGIPFASAIAFDLSKPSPVDFIYSPSLDKWEIELKVGQSTVVARTTNHFDRQSLLSQGLEQAQRILDLVAFEKRNNILIQYPGDTHILLFKRTDQLILQHVDVLSSGVSFSAQITITDKDGKVVSDPLHPPVWTPGLRFYRISQASQDLYEAYRNLFLGFEAILNAVCPKQSSEGERLWLLRAIRTIGQNLDLSQFVPSNCTDPSAYIVDTQYINVRCRLFHAKISSTLDIPNPEEVASAYDQLVRIWRQIAQSCLSVRGGGGGAMTYVGFRKMMDTSLSKNLMMYFTEDPSPAKEDDREISPLGKPFIEFETIQYLSETSSGHVSFVGTYPIRESSKLPVIYRICSKVKDSLMTVSSLKEGINLESVDSFESYQTIRMINKDLPKLVFGYSPD